MENATMTKAGEAMGTSGQWIGRGLSGVAILFLAMDTAGKLFEAAPAVEATVQLGYPAAVVFPIGLLQLACLALYVVPRTSVLGAVLLTAYLGGAVATHVRVGNPIATHTLFPTYVAAFVWAGIWLRDARVRAFLSAGK